MGNPGDYGDLEGVVFPRGDADWFATLRFESPAYIKDDDAKHWDAADMLKSFKEGTEAANEARKKMGVRGLEITGWAQEPTYAADSHRLVWAMKSREVGAQANGPQGVNYNTYALGREGYMSLNLVTGLDDLPTVQGRRAAVAGRARVQRRQALRRLQQQHRARSPSTAWPRWCWASRAKKLGLLAVIGAFFLKFAKIIILAVVGFGGAIMKLFGPRRASPRVLSR